MTPLALASNEGYIDCVKTLLDYRAAIEAKGPYNETPLFFAAAKGHSEIVRLLMYHGADINIKKKFDEFNPLDVAIKRKQE